LVDLHVHSTLEEAERAVVLAQTRPRRPRTWLFSGHATRSYLDVRFEYGDAMVFGKESVGLADELLAERAEAVIGIPMPGVVRSQRSRATLREVAALDADRGIRIGREVERRRVGSNDDRRRFR